jgi:hypothetical protein
MGGFLDALLAFLGFRRPAPELRFDIGPITAKGADPMLTLTDEQKCHLSIQPVTAAGNPARVDGAPSWEASDQSILALAVADDGMSADIVTVGPLGSCQVKVTADADLGSGVRSITGVLDVEVIAAEAASMSVVAGTPELK